MASVSPSFDSSSDRTAASSASAHHSGSATAVVPALYEVNGDHLRAGFAAAASWLELKAASVNALNVFPVPDGDTGTNMSMTMRAAVEAAAVELAPEAHAVARAVARGALMGARGNSGVILSQLIRGFAEAISTCDVLTVSNLADGLEEAAKAGYRAVGKPVEGTILTVARRVGEEARAAANDGLDVLAFWERVLHGAEAAVRETTGQLPALQRAGVVDAGGQGYMLIIEALWRTTRGDSMEDDDVTAAAAPVASQALVAAQHVEEGGLGFCTEFLITGATEPEEAIRSFMELLGDSVIVVGDGSILRVHIHTPQPGVALDWAIERGTVSSIKIENMQLQHDAGGTGQRGLSKIGVIAVSPGPGFKALFTSMGAAAIIDGGQSMNPSVQDILTTISSVGYQELLLLPNNSNIVLAAQQAAEQTPRTVRIVPTHSLPHGIAALLAFNYGEDLDTNVRLMEAAAGRAASIEVTYAERTADVDGVAVQQGQAIALLDDTLVSVGDSLAAVALDALAQAAPESREIVTIYWGADTDQTGAAALSDAIADAYPNLEAEIAEGGQPHYPFIISLE